MKRKVKKIGAAILVVISVLCLIKMVPIITSGYQMYKQAIAKRSIEDTVAALKSDQDYVTIDEIAPDYLKGVVASEDKRFYKHGAIDILSILRAIGIDIKEGRFAEGGSTITQQLAKNMYFSFDKKLERKVAEVFVAIDLEKKYTKDEILEMYCNIAYFGEGCYGLKEASAYYYGVEPAALDANQIKALIWTLKSPNYYHPQVEHSPQ